MKSCKTSVFLATLLAPAVASADIGDEIHKYGMGVSVGGGAVALVSTDVEFTELLGVGWEARVAFGTKTRLHVEAAYIGSFYGLGQSDEWDRDVLGTGVEGNFRVNLFRGNIQPYFLGGVGWTRFTVVKAGLGGPQMGPYNVAMLPMGLGLGFRLGNATLDLRAVYRKTAFGGMGYGDLSSLGVGLRAGFEY